MKEARRCFCRFIGTKKATQPQNTTEILMRSPYNGDYHKREGGKCTMKFM